MAEKHLKKQRSFIQSPNFKEEPGDNLDEPDTIWEPTKEEFNDGDPDTIWEPSGEESDDDEPSGDDVSDDEPIHNEPVGEPVEKLDNEWKPDPPRTTQISRSKKSPSSSGIKKNKKVKSPAKIKDLPSGKPRIKRNNIAHVKIYGKFKCNFCEKCKHKKQLINEYIIVER